MPMLTKVKITDQGVVDHMLRVLDESYLIYTAKPESRGTDGQGGCYYETKDGKHCSVGRCMLPSKVGPRLSGNVEDLTDESSDRCDIMSLDPLLKRRYKGLPLLFWSVLQEWHDNDRLWYPKAIHSAIGEGGTEWGDVDFDGVRKEYLRIRENVITGNLWYRG